MPQSETKKSRAWWTITILVALVAITFWLFYLQPAPEQISPASLNVTRASDTIISLQSDLRATDVNSLDSALADTDKELTQ